jgi:hypothetical protein
VGNNSGAVDPSLNLQVEMPGGVRGLLIQAGVPTGVTAAELLLNGQSLGSVPLLPSQPHQLTFNCPPAALGPDPVLTLQVKRVDGSLAVGPACTLAGVKLPPVPVLAVGDIEFPAFEAESPTGMPWLADKKVYMANAPSWLAFERSPTLKAISFSFGIMEGAYAPDQPAPTDGVELQVSLQPESGPTQLLLKKKLNPRWIFADRGPQLVKIDLPGKIAGTLRFLISPGPNSDPSCDWSYISRISGQAPPIALDHGSERHLPIDYTAALGMAQVAVGAQLVAVIHVPAMLEFQLKPSMRTIKGEYGLLDVSWNGEKGHTAGIDFIAEQVAPGGVATELWRQRLDPANVPADRGLHTFTFDLPQPVVGTLRLRSAPAHPPDISFGYSYWANLIASPAP